MKRIPLLNPVVSPGLTSGQYYLTTSPAGAGTNSALGNGTLRVAPWVVYRQVSISRVGAEITVIGDVGSKLRLVIYADTGFGYPGSLALDAGQINGDSATVQELTVSATLTAGLYWVGGALQSVTTTQPTVRSQVSGWWPPVLLPFGTSIPSAGGNTGIGLQTGSVTGTPPGTFPAGAGGSTAAPRVFVKVA